MANKIKIRRGQKVNLPLPNTELWELRYAHDTSELFIDDGTNNVLLATNEVSTDMNSVVREAIGLKQNSFPGISEATPISAENISINTATRVLTITPPLGYFDFYVDGSGVTKKYTKTGIVNFPAFADTTGVWYFHFDDSGNPQVSQTVWSDFSAIAPVYRIYWNSTLVGAAKSVVEAIETHLNDISAKDHSWKHKNGTIWMSGFNAIHNRLVTGTPATDGSNTVFALTTGKNMDDNLEYTVTNGSGSAKFEQILGNTSAGTLNATNSALFEIRTNDAGGLLNILPATRFPFPWDSATNRPEYITTNGTRSLVSNGRFFVTFIYALQEPRNGKAIKIVPAYQEFTTLTNAQAFVWEDLQAVYPTVADNEIRPLYKLIFEYRNTYAVNCKYSVIRQVDDLRKTKVTTNSTAGGAMLATSVIVTPSGTLSSTNAQSALLELDTEKVAKVTALDNAITRFDGTLGDVQSSLATVSDTGSVDIPTGQNFTINGIALKDVAETLTNKTINSPTITGTPTGITATHVGLGNVVNADTSNPANITWTESYRTVTDTEKTAWNGKVSASDVVTTVTANKILKLDANAKLPANITGNADGNSATATKLQTARTINGVSFDGSANITINAVDSTSRIASSEKGIVNGVATLDTAGKVPSSQLPSYVDDVLEYANIASFPATGEASKIYVALDVNLTYRWGGSNYVEISPSIALGETSTTAYRGDGGKVAYDHSQLTGGTNPHNTTFANIVTKPTTIAGYGITDGVTLVGSQTLINKTLTSPVMNRVITGAGITTTGEANRLVKTISAGNISMTQSVDGGIGIALNNTSAGSLAYAGLNLKSDLANQASLVTYGSGRTTTLFGAIIANKVGLVTQGADCTGLLIGTLSPAPIVIGTNGVERYNINSNGIHTFTTPATTSYNAIFRNTSYAATDVSGASSIKIGYSNHDGVKIEAYKEAINVSGIKFYGEHGFGTEKLLLNLKSSDGSANFSGNITSPSSIGSLVGSTVYEDTTKEIYVGDSVRRTALRVNQRLGTFTPFGAINSNGTAGARDFRIYSNGLGTGMASTDGSILEYDGVNLNLLPKGYGRITIGSDIVGNTGMTALPAKLVVSNTASSIILAKAYSVIANQGGMLCLGKSRGVASGTETTTLSGDNLGYISFEGVGNGSNPVIGATIEGVQNGTAGASFIPADMVFKTCTGTAQNEVFRLRTDKNAVFSGYMGQYRGMNVASATTITPSGQIFHVTGTTAIATINIPYTGFNGTITIIPDDIFTTTTAGNIGLATTAAVNRALTMTYDSTTAKWYPSY